MFHYLTTRNSDLNGLRRELDRVFDDFWTAPPAGSALESPASWAPVADIEEESDHYLVSLEVPGMKKDDLKIEVADGQILISGERRQEEKKERKGSFYSERRFGRFQRAFAVPSHIDASKIEAHYQDGVLKLYVPKAETAKPRQVKIGDGASSGVFGKLLGKKGEEKSSPDPRVA